MRIGSDRSLCRSQNQIRRAINGGRCRGMGDSPKLTATFLAFAGARVTEEREWTAAWCVATSEAGAAGWWCTVQHVFVTLASTGEWLGQHAWPCACMLCISVPLLVCASGTTRHAAELTTKASKQRTATKLENACFILYCLRRSCDQLVTPAATVYQDAAVHSCLTESRQHILTVMRSSNPTRTDVKRKVSSWAKPRSFIARRSRRICGERSLVSVCSNQIEHGAASHGWIQSAAPSKWSPRALWDPNHAKRWKAAVHPKKIMLTSVRRQPPLPSPGREEV